MSDDNAEPIQEELEFIYGLLDTRSNEDILKDLQSRGYPPCSLGFVAQKRREFNAAKNVLNKRKIEHFSFLSGCLGILGYGLDYVKKSNQLGSKFEYTRWVGDCGKGMTRKQLTDTLAKNLSSLKVKCNEQQIDSFFIHLKAEYPKISAQKLDDLIYEEPNTIVDLVNELLFKKTFKGSCLFCQE